MQGILEIFGIRLVGEGDTLLGIVIAGMGEAEGMAHLVQDRPEADLGEPYLQVGRRIEVEPDVAGLASGARMAGIGRIIIVVGREVAEIDVGRGDISFDELDVDDLAQQREGLAYPIALGGGQRLERALLRRIDLGGEIEETVGDGPDPGSRRRVRARAVPRRPAPRELADHLFDGEDRLAVGRVGVLRANHVSVLVA